MELLEQYQKQYIEFCNIDDFNLEQRAKKVPAEKHFWVSRLIEAKIKKGQLLKQKKQLKFEVTKKLIEQVNDPELGIKSTLTHVQSATSSSELLIKNIDQSISDLTNAPIYKFLVPKKD